MVGPTGAWASDATVVNGGFQIWKEGVPEGWSARGVGREDKGETSLEFERGGEITQAVALRPGETYRLAFTYARPPLSWELRGVKGPKVRGDCGTPYWHARPLAVVEKIRVDDVDPSGAVLIFKGANGARLGRVELAPMNGGFTGSVIEHIGENKAVARFGIHNAGEKPATYSYEAEVADFFLKPLGRREGVVTLEPGQSWSEEVEFSPGESKRYRARLSFSENDGERREEVDFWEADYYGNAFRESSRIASAELQMRPKAAPDFAAEEPVRKVALPYAIPNVPVKPENADKNFWATFASGFEAKRRPGTRVLLDVPLAAVSPEVFVNGEKAGGAPGHLPLRADVTPFIRDGKNKAMFRVMVSREGMLKIEDEKNAETRTPLFPYTGFFGILSSVWVRKVPDVRVEDAVVGTSFRNAEITVQYTLVNDTRQSAMVDLAPEILYRGVPEKTLPMARALIPAESRIQMSVRTKWENPKLWMPHAPELYQLKTKLFANGRQIDEQDVRFGFKEAWIEGKYVYWNGKCLKLLTRLAYPHPQHSGLEPTVANYWRALRQYTDGGIWFVRNFSTTDPLRMELMDEMGVACRFSGDFNFAFDDWRMQLPESDDFWKLMNDHAEAFALEGIRHPCVLALTMENETFLSGVGDRFPEAFDRFRRMRQIVRGVTPGAIIEHDGSDPEGDADWINLHYPLNPARTIPYQAEYPPRIFEKDQWYGLQLYPGALVWNETKPLVLGEDFIGFPERLQSLSLFSDEQVYDVQDGNPGQMKNADAQDQAYHRMHEPFMIAARNRELAYITTFPVTETGLSDTLKPEVIFLDEPFRNCYAGKTLELNATVHHDLLNDMKGRLRWQVTDAEGKKIGDGSAPLDLKAGSMYRVPFKIQIPKGKEGSTANLSLELNADGRTLASRRETFRVFARTGKSFQIRMFDPSGKTTSAIRAAGGSVTLAESPQSGQPFFLGENALVEATPEQRASWLDFVRDGGTLVVLQQQGTLPDWLPMRLNANNGFHAFAAFPRSASHPVTRGLREEDLRFWRGSGYRVASSPYWKPRGGNLVSLIDIGTIGGYLTTAMAELPFGKGNVLLCQLDLIANLSREPAADRLFARLLDYALSKKYFSAEAGVEVRSPSLKVAADELGLRSEEKANVLLADASAVSTEQAKELIGEVRAGKTLWLVGMTPEVESVWRAAGFPALNLKPSPRSSVIKRSHDRLLDGLSNSDLYFVGMTLAPLPGEYATTEIQSLAEYESAPEGRPVEILLDHGTLVKIPEGEGHVLLDLTNWYKEGYLTGQRGKRLPATLATNLGLHLDATGEDRSDPSSERDFHPISLTAAYNENLSNVLKDHGKVFGGVPFDLHPGEKGVILLGSTLMMPTVTDKFPSESKAIPVERKFDGIEFLMAAFDAYEGGRGYGSGEVIGGIDIRYKDGSSERMQLMHKVHVVNLFEYMGDLAAGRVVWSGPTPFATWLDLYSRWPGNRWIQRDHPNNLYLVRWLNPHPERPIASLQFYSANTHVVPLILAATGFNRK